MFRGSCSGREMDSLRLGHSRQPTDSQPRTLEKLPNAYPAAEHSCVLSTGATQNDHLSVSPNLQSTPTALPKPLPTPLSSQDYRGHMTSPPCLSQPAAPTPSLSFSPRHTGRALGDPAPGASAPVCVLCLPLAPALPKKSQPLLGPPLYS